MPPIGNISDAAQALEANLLRQMLSSSGAFKKTSMAGSQLQTDMFIEALADAVSQAGGLGLAGMLEQSLEPGGAQAAPAERPAGVSPAPARWNPLSGQISGEITSAFGKRTDPLDGSSRFHTGIDLRGPEGAPIHAAASGVVKSAGPRGGYGNAVEIDHGNGLSTLYAHASALGVKPGDRVERGEAIGEVGQTGRATGPHLHFEVRKEGKPIDPTFALKAYGIRADNPSGGKP